MPRKSWVYVDGKAIEKGTPEYEEYLGARFGNGPMISPDDQDFVSPIDGKLYRGRAGMREHNRKHDVVNNRDLVGLPYRTTHTEYTPDRAAIRNELINAARKLGHI